MYDELTPTDIKKMEDEIEYRKLVVRKEAIAAVKANDFYISVEHHSDVDRDEETLDYNLSLNAAAEEDRDFLR